MPTGNIALKIVNLHKNQSYTIRVRDNAYKAGQKVKSLPPTGEKGAQSTITHQAAHDYGWYDLSVSIDGFSLFEKRYAGRVETGKDGYSDPVMG
jgi:phospholipase C